jgi:hypothetical protein
MNICLEGSKKVMKTSTMIACLQADWMSGNSKYEAGVLFTLLQYSVCSSSSEPVSDNLNGPGNKYRVLKAKLIGHYD